MITVIFVPKMSSNPVKVDSNVKKGGIRFTTNVR